VGPVRESARCLTYSLSGKAKTRDGRMCVMCGITPVQPYGAHIIPCGVQRGSRGALPDEISS
jgi:hypothetical protein